MRLRNLLLRNQRLRSFARKAVYVVRPGAKRWYDRLDRAYASGRWGEVVEMVSAAVAQRKWFLTPGAYVRLAQAHSQLGNFAQAAESLSAGADAYPSSLPMLSARAELAMVQGAYGDAIKFWQAFAHAHSPDGISRRKRFPLRGSDFVWYDKAWTELYEAWPAPGDAEQPSPAMYRWTIETLRLAKQSRAAERLALRAFSDHPDVRSVAGPACDYIVRANLGVGVEAAAALITEGNESAVARQFSRRMVAARSVLTELAQMPGSVHPEVVRVLVVRRHTPASLVLLASNFWDEGRLHSEALRLARRDHWPEGPSSSDRISRAAWNESRRFARGRGEEIGVSDDTLARAVFHNVKHELVLKIPMDRIAEEISANHNGEPIFVSLPSSRIGYLASYPNSKFDVVYLYDALRRRGLPVHWVLHVTKKDQSSFWDTAQGAQGTGPSILFEPTVAGLRPSSRELTDGPQASRDLVATSGMRSVAALLDRVPGALVLNSGSALKAFAYDRSFRQLWEYPVHSSVHPSDVALETVRVDTEVVESWHREGDSLVQKGPSAPADAVPDIFLAHGAWPQPPWHELMAGLLLPYFGRLVDNASKLAQEIGATDVHMSDYLYAESALVSGALARRGADVHIWPHSSNPVHVAFHDADAVKTVHAVTRSGVDLWKRTLPHAKVIHDPELMLQRPHPSQEWTAGAPLSLVVIGGRPIMRHLPLLDYDAHEHLHRKFFTELAPLVEAGLVSVHFKPRGFSGENEAWLEEVAGGIIEWRPVLEHPMRIDLPNPVFASVSVGSSALLEGISRGIPGLIVREGLARDYLVMDGELVPALDASSAANYLKSRSTQQAWQEWRDRQVGMLASEFDDDTFSAQQRA